jgi:hypothetical protein
VSADKRTELVEADAAKGAAKETKPEMERGALQPWLVPQTRRERWRSAMAARTALLFLGLVALTVHAIDPDVVTLDTGGLALLGILAVIALAPILRDFSLPGGGGGTFVDDVEEAAAALEKAEAETPVVALGEPVDDMEGQEPNGMLSAGVEDLAAVAPRQGLIALRREMSDRLSELHQALVGGTPPSTDYELVRQLAANGVINSEQATAAYAVLGATERGARDRDVPVDAVRELISVTDRLLRDVRASADPGLRFEAHVGDVLKQMVGRERVHRQRRGGDFSVDNTLVEARYVRPGTSPDTVIRRTVRQIEGYLAKSNREGMHAIVVVNDDVDPAVLSSDRVATSSDRIAVKRLADLRAADLRAPDIPPHDRDGGLAHS